MFMIFSKIHWWMSTHVMILCFWTDRSRQTVLTQIGLLLKRNLTSIYPVCNSICIFWMHYSVAKPHCSNVRIITVIISGVWFLIFFYGNVHTFELDSLGRMDSKIVLFLLWASISTNMTDHEAPWSPNRFIPLIDSNAALAKPMELQKMR